MAQSPVDLLREALARSGLSARQVARKSGVTESRLSDYLSGRHDPSATRLIYLLKNAGQQLQLQRDFDQNGLVLPELLDLADALSVGRSSTKPAFLPTFNELVSAGG